MPDRNGIIHLGPRIRFHGIGDNAYDEEYWTAESRFRWIKWFENGHEVERPSDPCLTYTEVRINGDITRLANGLMSVTKKYKKPIFEVTRTDEIWLKVGYPAWLEPFNWFSFDLIGGPYFETEFTWKRQQNGMTGWMITRKEKRV